MHIVFMLMFYGWIVFMLQTMVYSFKKYESFNMFKSIHFLFAFHVELDGTGTIRFIY